MGTKVKEAKKIGFSVLGLIVAAMSELGQIFGSKYDKTVLMLKVSVNDDYFVSTESKVTTDGREFFVINLVEPTDPKIKVSLPISGDPESEEFEIWRTKCNADFMANGKVITKGTEKIRCYAVAEE